MELRAVHEGSFRQEVLHHDGPVLVAFRAAWCAASRELGPSIEELASGFDGRAKAVAVDVDGGDLRANAVCRRYNVTRVPVVLLFDQGRVRDFVGGAASKETIAEMVERRLRPVLEVGAHDFDLEVIHHPDPVLAHFHSASCGPSLELVPVIDEVAQKYRGRAKVVRVELAGDTAGLAARYGVVRVPTLALFKGGRVADQLLGGLSGGKGGDARASFESIAGMLEEFIL